MQNELQESTIEETMLPEGPSRPQAADYALPEQTSRLHPWLRFAYTVEYLLVLQVALTVWSDVGGQGHMDLLPWYLKLACVAVLSWCVVRFTAAVVEFPNFWTRRSRLWFGAALLLTAAMGIITYYYHLHEALDDPNSDETSSTSVRLFQPGTSRTA